MRAHKGTRVPAGTGLGNLRANYHLSHQTQWILWGNLQPGKQNICAVGNIFRIADCQIHERKTCEKRTTRCVVRDPFLSLACVARTQEGICDGVTLAQVVTLNAGRPRIVVSLGERIDGERCERDKTTRLADARQTKEGDSQPPWHVEMRYAATVHAFWPRLLND
jgi:hypothetical protein